ncbi:pentapeptide repeat-containing protein [Rothia dentocariosa]|uniref:pentapeptide repeat-containing protein n=1 Tax=Rothia dentocariosa TaxID=2047 RepID=UPI00195F13A7|nr:pentapeptide repeat-containing protein [Rothia dentocariosa]VTY10597.1 Pentapeptide repeats (9 copies) [Rothia dentocariosa]
MNAICSCFAAWSTWCTLWAVTIALAFILAALHFARHKKKPKWLLRNIEWLRTFYVWLGALVILGGTWAFFLPIALNSGFNKNDDGPVLRQLLIYATGGLLGAITLGETRRKNDQEHMRQVHAERRSRYAKAIEQLADEKAPIRLGGVYTLVKLVDDWMDDEKTLPSEEDRRQEGQIIIDSLCTYIRSSFPLAERHEELSSDYEDYKKKCQNNKIKIYIPQSYKNFIKDFSFGHKNSKYNNQPIQSREEFVRDKSLFQEEQEVRKTILSEIKNRLRSTPRNKDGRDEIKPGTWSSFEYNFSNAVFFYDVNFNEVNFSGKKTSFLETKFTQKADFSGSIFNEITDFSEAYFHEKANFNEAHFYRDTNFNKAHFHEKANFNEAHFYRDTNFNKAHFHGNAIFYDTTFNESKKFHGVADFSEVQFDRDAEFDEADFYGDAIFQSIFTGCASFSGVNFYETDISNNSAKFIGAEFHGVATFSQTQFHMVSIFSGATFYDITDFYLTYFHKGVTFYNRINKSSNEIYNIITIFEGDAIFYQTHFYRASNFSGAIFHKDTNFEEAYFDGDVTFSGATFCRKPIFTNTTHTLKPEVAWFSFWGKHKFDVAPDSLYNIKLEEHRSPDGTTTLIPKGCIVFNPETKEPILNYRDILILFDKKYTSTVNTLRIKENLKMSNWPRKSE